ncbi:hypothetical protein V5O48_006434 [Marasmius crinis-equi]|uniref:Uncharacterized protein n=1 Tax=Marasmius crinis-equi TaxID=585013 RepID=A0ABR3FJH4_9AGAR
MSLKREFSDMFYGYCNSFSDSDDFTKRTTHIPVGWRISAREESLISRFAALMTAGTYWVARLNTGQDRNIEKSTQETHVSRLRYVPTGETQACHMQTVQVRTTSFTHLPREPEPLVVKHRHYEDSTHPWIRLRLPKIAKNLPTKIRTSSSSPINPTPLVELGSLNGIGRDQDRDGNREREGCLALISSAEGATKKTTPKSNYRNPYHAMHQHQASATNVNIMNPGTLEIAIGRQRTTFVILIRLIQAHILPTPTMHRASPILVPSHPSSRASSPKPTYNYSAPSTAATGSVPYHHEQRRHAAPVPLAAPSNSPSTPNPASLLHPQQRLLLQHRRYDHDYQQPPPSSRSHQPQHYNTPNHQRSVSQDNDIVFLSPISTAASPVVSTASIR